MSAPPLDITKELDAILEFRRRTPVSRLDGGKLDEFAEALDLDRDGYDIGRRKEARILSFGDGRIQITDDGGAFLRLRGWPWDKASTLLQSFVRVFCGTYGWDAETEDFLLHLDVDVECGFPAAASSEHMMTWLSPEALDSLAMPNEQVRAAGVRLFLDDVDNPDEDLRLRIEPLTAEPHSKAFVNVMGTFRRVRLSRVAALVTRLSAIVSQTRSNLGGMA